MIKKIITIIALLIFIIPVSIKAGLFHLGDVSTAQAVGDLTVDWGVPSGQAIFKILTMLPGDTASRTVKVTNGASANRPIGLQSLKTAETKNFAEVLKITISKDGTPIFGPQKLAEFFEASKGPDYIDFDTLTSGQSAEYTFTVEFPSVSTNEYQNASIIFDLIIGIAFQLPVECEGKKYDKVIFGTERSETLRGTNKNDLILGFEGNDILDGSNGNDCLIGGPGDDRLNGSNGNDVLMGNEGNDTLNGSNGDDVLYGGSGNDILNGSNGTDKMYGGDGDDRFFGSNGKDYMIGGPGNDTFDASNGDDYIEGNEGDDRMIGGNGNDTLLGGPGTKDYADGGLGTDRCDAETKIKCER